MEYRTLELNLTSAKDLKDVNLFSKMDVYAVVSLSGDQLHHQKTKTPVDRDGGANPTWNFPIKFTVNESLARQNRLTLEINLRCQRTLGADKDIGQVHIPVKELLDQTGDGKSFQHVSYQVRRPSGKPKGALNLSYKIGEKVAAPVKAPPVSAVPKAEPVTAYPPPAMGSTSATYAAPYPGGYPPPPQQYAAGYGYPPPPQYPQAQQGYGYPAQPGYGYPPQAGYGYPQQGGYGYPPQGQRPGKNKFGMGLGAGLLGGAVGGLLIGDMISDGGGYDAGYDAGFDDAGGGFDF
ncbi:protein SRC2-like [Gastrolobium bilobum]|uniref:protein SRC2-like n=1 Tax=Gastrolobium bilobum TaxID=150636 RepID=UPI002AB13851|nr:protein SRC2-like [Gastrolobium bilobum]